VTGGEIVTVVSVGGKLIKVGRAAKAALDWYKEMPSNRRMREAGELFDTVRDIASAEYLTRRESEARDAEAFRLSVQTMLADHQFARLQGALGFEAAREATDERLEMLGHAAAGLSDPDMSINEKARIERAIRQLDGEDILFLHELRHFEDSSFIYDPRNDSPEPKQRSWHNAKKRLFHAQEKPLSRVALTVAGCISEDSGFAGGPILPVSALAERVLAVMQSYIEEKRDG
jgi:hypothetical protein